MQDYCDAEYQPGIKSCGFMDDVEQKNLRAGYHLVSNENACAVVCAVQLPSSASVCVAEWKSLLVSCFTLRQEKLLGRTLKEPAQAFTESAELN